MKKNNKDMFEQFRDKELPPDIQAHIESAANIHGKGNKNKWWFTAGFFVGVSTVLPSREIPLSIFRYNFSNSDIL